MVAVDVASVSLASQHRFSSRVSEKSIDEEVLLIFKQISALDQNIALLQPNINTSISSSELFSSDGESSLITKLTLQKKRYERRLAKLQRQLDQTPSKFTATSDSHSTASPEASSCCAFRLLGLLPAPSCVHNTPSAAAWRVMRNFKSALAVCTAEFNADARKGLDSFLAAFPTLFRSTLLVDLKYTKAGPRPGSTKTTPEDAPKKKSQKVAIDEASNAILSSLTAEQVRYHLVHCTIV